MSTRVLSASTRYASEAARDAASGWDDGDVVYVTGVGYTVFDGSEWSPLGAGSGGTQLLGPFAVNFDTPGVDDDGVALATLDVGAIILSAWVVTTTAWLANGVDTGHEAFINRGPDTGDATTEYPTFGPLTTGTGFGTEGPSDTPTHLIQIVTADARTLTVAVYPAAGSFTTGSLDCYALIVAPV